MKNIIKYFLSIVLLVSYSSCEDSNNVIDQVMDNTETGAVLRTIEVISATLNSSIPSTAFSVEIEEQDEQDGALLESVDVYVTIRDLTPDNGTTPASEALVKSIPASEFTTGPVGLPRAIITATFGEAEAAMGLDATTHAPGDLFVFELRLNLTDGRTFGAADAAGIITGGFFSSPYKYNTLLLCSPEPGVYTIDMHDTYGDGWQTDNGSAGAGLTITIDGVDTEVGLCSQWAASDFDCTPTDGYEGTATVTIPVGAESATWFFPGDAYAEISFEVYAPDGSLLLAVGIGEGTPGLLPITLCAQ